MRKANSALDIDFRLKKDGEDFQWINLSGTVTLDENGERSRIVGCIHNIHQHKLLVEEQKRKRRFDSITSFYPLP